jgi:hypothetical protein
MPTSCDPPVAVNETRIVPLLGVVIVFAATAKVAVPVPVPDVVLGVMNVASDAADQPQFAPVVTVTCSVPPLAMKFVVFVVTEYVQGLAAWLMSNVAPPPLVPARVSRAVRAPPLFAATVNGTLIEPLPDGRDTDTNP